ncbi:hypothetical protein [Pseudoblastomonas flavescens]|uniref:hypothetical protein n=1 Tax=Alteriqipengyuania flavescens TaxID=3053610 RepID=UPI0038508B10
MRYEFDVSNDLTGFVQPQVFYSASKFTDIITINRIELDSYTIVDLSAGVQTADYRIEVFGSNLFDERAEVAGNYINDRERITTNRPLTVGVRIGYDY